MWIQFPLFISWFSSLKIIIVQIIKTQTFFTDPIIPLIFSAADSTFCNFINSKFLNTTFPIRTAYPHLYVFTLDFKRWFNINSTRNCITWMVNSTRMIKIYFHIEQHDKHNTQPFVYNWLALYRAIIGTLKIFINLFIELS